MATLVPLKQAISWTPYLMGQATPLKLTQTRGGMILKIPEGAYTPIDTIVVLTPQAISR